MKVIFRVRKDRYRKRKVILIEEKEWYCMIMHDKGNNSENGYMNGYRNGVVVVVVVSKSVLVLSLGPKLNNCNGKGTGAD